MKLIGSSPAIAPFFEELEGSFGMLLDNEFELL